MQKISLEIPDDLYQDISLLHKERQWRRAVSIPGSLVKHEVGAYYRGYRFLNWLQKIATPIKTEDLPQLLAQAIQYEVGGEWESTEPVNWTKRFEDIIGKQPGLEEKYLSGFWVNCKAGDGYFQQKWGVRIEFTVISGSSNTIFDSEFGDWDFSITVSVQWASPNSWTADTPYPLLIRSAGSRENIRTIQEVANFVKEAIWRDQRDQGDEDEPEVDLTPDPVIGVPVPSRTLV